MPIWTLQDGHLCSCVLNGGRKKGTQQRQRPLEEERNLSSELMRSRLQRLSPEQAAADPGADGAPLRHRRLHRVAAFVAPDLRRGLGQELPVHRHGLLLQQAVQGGLLRQLGHAATCVSSRHGGISSVRHSVIRSNYNYYPRSPSIGTPAISSPPPGDEL